MPKRKNAFIVVAHPDDETIFFSGLILSHKNFKWTIICVTDGNGDGRGTARKKEFFKACRKLGANKIHWLGLPDSYSDRLNLNEIKISLARLDRPDIVYTHGPLGEYGHPHHQDVCMAVYEHYLPKTPVWGVSYNSYPELKIHLTEQQYRIKTGILRDIYFDETNRFIHILPAMSEEHFYRWKLNTVREMYKYMRNTDPKLPTNLGPLKWLAKHLPEYKKRASKRTF